MMFKETKQILSNERPIKDIWHYFIGNYRYKIFYSGFKSWLLRRYIREQIEFRLNYVPDKCWNRGSCVACGCMIPNLQMAEKSCDEDCYPEIMNAKDWYSFGCGNTIRQKEKYWRLNIATNVLILTQNTHQYVPERRPKLR